MSARRSYSVGEAVLLVAGGAALIALCLGFAYGLGYMAGHDVRLVVVP